MRVAPSPANACAPAPARLRACAWSGENRPSHPASRTRAKQFGELRFQSREILPASRRAPHAAHPKPGHSARPGRPRPTMRICSPGSVFTDEFSTVTAVAGWPRGARRAAA